MRKLQRSISNLAFNMLWQDSIDTSSKQLGLLKVNVARGILVYLKRGGDGVGEVEGSQDGNYGDFPLSFSWSPSPPHVLPCVL